MNYTDKAMGGGAVSALQVAPGTTPEQLASELGVSALMGPPPAVQIGGRLFAAASMCVPSASPVVGGVVGSLVVIAGGTVLAANEGDWVVTFSSGQIRAFSTAAFNSRFAAA